MNYILKRNPKSHNLRLTIKSDARIIVSAPLFLSEEKIQYFVQEKSAWIFRKIEEIKNSNAISLPQIKRHEYPKYRLQAYHFILGKLERFNQFYNFEYKNIF